MKNAVYTSEHLAGYLQRAMALFDANWGGAFTPKCCLEVLYSRELSLTYDGRKMLITSSFVERLDEWRELEPNGYNHTIAYTWLFLHEFAHAHLGHFSFSENFGVVQRTIKKLCTHTVHPRELRSNAQMCLELQADHEAIEVMLGAYASEGWEILRTKIVSITAIMVVIEQIDEENSINHATHPKAATRIFQLLGHLAELPLVRAQIEQDASLIPTEEELQAFAYDVTIPCFFDAVHLAQATGAASIASDLGRSEDFFRDVEIAKLGDPSRYGELKTQGAQEWAKLWPCNEALKPILGGHFRT